MACHTLDRPLDEARVREIVRDELHRRNEQCSACGGLRLQVRQPCPHVGCPMREAVQLEEAA